MNNIRNSIKYTVLLGALCSVLAGINSCSSRENDSPSKEEVNGTVLRVKIAGIADNVEVEASPLASKNNNMITGTSSESSTNITEKMLNLNGFDALVSIEKSNPNNGLARTAMASSSKIGTTASGLMNVGAKYRLMIYDAADTNHTTPVVNIEATSGTDPAIKIDAGKNYTWYAFSLNENTTVPVVNNGVVAKAGLKNKDILLASGNLNAQYGENYLNIIFNHNTARINVAIDSRGMFGIMNANPLRNLNVGGSDILKYGDLNVFTGTYSNTSSYTVADVTPVNTYGNAVKTYTYYTADNTTVVPANGLKANIAATGIVKKDPFGGADVTVPIPDNTTIGFKNNAFTPTYNNAYTLNIRLIESGVKVGGITWARSNIGWYTDPVMGTTRNFDPDPKRAYKLTSSSNYYFYWGFPTPYEDYCSNVYPKGTWKLPTIEQLEILKTKSYTIRLIYSSSGSTLANANGVAGYEYDLDSGSVINPAYPEFAQKLFLPIAGIYDNNTYSRHAFFIKETDGQINNLELNLWSADHVNILKWTSAYNENGSKAISHKGIARYTAPGGSSYNTTIRCVRA